jgi:hypothetical protein
MHAVTLMEECEALDAGRSAPLPPYYAGRIDVTSDGSVAVLGATTVSVLETAAEVFENSSASRDERAVLTMSEEVAARPISRSAVEQLIGEFDRRS